MNDRIQLSPLGFGCASVMGKVGRTQALKAMSVAFDLGVTHFDVARSYGFGRAEKVVGEFIKARRDQVTVTSKFGVIPPTLSLRTKTIIPLARISARLFPQLKRKLKNKSGQLLAERRFDVAYAEECLNRSLTELGTDYIDIYLIHEPDISVLKNQEEIAAFFERTVKAGKIRRWGLAYAKVNDYEWDNLLGGDIIQFESNFETLPYFGSILEDKRQRIVTRPFRGGLTDKSRLEAVVTEMDMIAELQELNASIADLSMCLASYIAGPDGSVLCSMFSHEHIKRNIFALNKLSIEAKMINLVNAILMH